MTSLILARRMRAPLGQPLGAAEVPHGTTAIYPWGDDICQHIRANVEGEIESLLSVNKVAINDFLDSIFADHKIWIGIGTFLYSLAQGGPLLTAGAAIGTLARVGSKAMKAAAEADKKIETSDYALLYRMRR